MMEEQSFEYHLYRLDTPTTIKENQTKQVALMSASGIPVTKQYLIHQCGQCLGPLFDQLRRGRARERDGEAEFVNDEKSKAGVPLPKGIVRVYKADSQGDAVFVGEIRSSTREERGRET